MLSIYRVQTIERSALSAKQQLTNDEHILVSYDAILNDTIWHKQRL